MNRLDVVGNSVLEAEINEITEPLERRAVSLRNLQGAVSEITALYLVQGYLTSMALLSPQTITSEQCDLEVQEATFSQVTFRFNNYLPLSIGSEWLKINDRFLNPAGFGDALLASYLTPLRLNVSFAHLDAYQ